MYVYILYIQCIKIKYIYIYTIYILFNNNFIIINYNYIFIPNNNKNPFHKLNVILHIAVIHLVFLFINL